MELGRDKTIAEIISRLKTARGNEGAVKVEGTWGAFARLLAAYISKELNRPILYICPHIDDSDKAVDDLHTFGAEAVEPLAAWEGEEDLADATDEIRAERLKLVSRMSYKYHGHPGRDTGWKPVILPTSVQALCQPIPKPKLIEQSSLRLRINKEMPPEEVAGWLVENGFERVDRIDLPGQFARRGGIVDIYAPVSLGKVLSGGPSLSMESAEAVRVEFFGDRIESIREVNLDTQRSSRQLKGINIISAMCGATSGERELFVNILPKGAIIILEEPAEIEEVANVFLERSEKAERLYSWADIYKVLDKFTQLRICRFATWRFFLAKSSWVATALIGQRCVNMLPPCCMVSAIGWIPNRNFCLFCEALMQAN